MLRPQELERLHLFRAGHPEGTVETDGRTGETLGSIFSLWVEHGG